MTLAGELRTLLGEATAAASEEHRVALGQLSRKLDRPLRVALAGRMKAGKSTLLNALIGERLAPTDASECTRLVTWYEHASEYRVSAEPRDGEHRDLPFRRAADGQLEIDLSGIDEGEVARLVVGWPSARLREMTLIDTPGLDSLSTHAGRTTDALAARGGGEREADAVVYLMRHAHRSDIAFLEAFHGPGAGQGTPVNSIAVLSRADEIGAGRLDALDSARWIARRYETDPRVRGLASTVVSVASLLAETAATLEEREAESLRLLARESLSTVESLVLSADHFRAPGPGPLTIELREELLARFGMFGVRFAIDAYHNGQWASAADLPRMLSARSGLPTLRDAIQGRFAARSRQLVSRSVLIELGRLAESGAFGPAIVRRLEELQSGAHEFAELAMLDLALSGDAGFSDDERTEAERVTAASSLAVRAGCEPEATSSAIQAAAIAGVARWRERAANPLATRSTVWCAETMARCFEGLYGAAAT